MTYRVLVIEESPLIRKALKAALPPPEFELIQFTEDPEEWKRLSQIQPDMIFLSLSLAIKEKPLPLSDLRSHDPSRKTPLILIRKIFDRFEREDLIELNADEVIQIPFDSQRLASLVRSLIESRKDPTSLPEESLLNETFPQEKEDDLQKRIKAVVRQELLEKEREIEERIRSRLFSEIKTWSLRKITEKQDKGKA